MSCFIYLCWGSRHPYPRRARRQRRSRRPFVRGSPASGALSRRSILGFAHARRRRARGRRDVRGESNHNRPYRPLLRSLVPGVYLSHLFRGRGSKTSTSESLRRAGGDADRESASLQPARRDPRSHRRATQVRAAARSPAVHPIEVPPRTLKPGRRGAHLQQLSPRRPPRPPAGRRLGRTARPTVSQRLDVHSTSSGASRRCRGHHGLPARRRSRRPRTTKQVNRTSPWPAETMGRRGRRRGRP